MEPIRKVPKLRLKRVRSNAAYHKDVTKSLQKSIIKARDHGALWDEIADASGMSEYDVKRWYYETPVR